MADVPDDAEMEALWQRGYRYALSLTHDRQRAEDLLQEACVSVLRSGGRWRIGILFRAIRHRLIDQLRRRGLKMESLDGGAEAALETYAARLASMEELDEDLGRALSILRPQERELLFLSAVEGMSAAEIARLTGRPRGTILSLLHRSKKVRKFLTGLRTPLR